MKMFLFSIPKRFWQMCSLVQWESYQSTYFLYLVTTNIKELVSYIPNSGSYLQFQNSTTKSVPLNSISFSLGLRELFEIWSASSYWACIIVAHSCSSLDPLEFVRKIHHDPPTAKFVAAHSKLFVAPTASMRLDSLLRMIYSYELDLISSKSISQTSKSDKSVSAMDAYNVKFCKVAPRHILHYTSMDNEICFVYCIIHRCIMQYKKQ